MIPAAYVQHELPHRIRFRIPAKRGDLPFFQTAMQVLRACSEVTASSANPRTASILVRHSGDTEAIASFVARHDLFEIRRKLAAPRRSRSAESSASRGFEPGSMASLGFSILAVYQAVRGRLAGNAVECVWASYQIRHVLSNRWLSAAYLGIGLYRMVTGPVLGSAATLAFYAASAHHLHDSGTSTRPHLIHDERRDAEQGSARDP